MREESKEATIAEHLLLKEEVINDLDQAVSDFQDEKIGGLEMLARAVNAWRKANENEALKKMIKEEMRRRRIGIHQIARLDISKHGDPIEHRYNPKYWVVKMPKYLKGKEEEFVLDRIGSLREFFVSLSPSK